MTFDTPDSVDFQLMSHSPSRQSRSSFSSPPAPSPRWMEKTSPSTYKGEFLHSAVHLPLLYLSIYPLVLKWNPMGLHSASWQPPPPNTSLLRIRPARVGWVYYSRPAGFRMLVAKPSQGSRGTDRRSRTSIKRPSSTQGKGSQVRARHKIPSRHQRGQTYICSVDYVYFTNINCS